MCESVRVGKLAAAVAMKRLQYMNMFFYFIEGEQEQDQPVHYLRWTVQGPQPVLQWPGSS